MSSISFTTRAWAREQLETLRDDYHDFNACTVPVLPYPNAVQFCKQVSKGRPCVYSLTETTSRRWPALSWVEEDLVSKVKDKLDVAVTPAGNADSLIPHPKHLAQKLFVEPANIQLTLEELMSKLHSTSAVHSEKSSRIAYYLQSQNSNLTSTPLAALLVDLQPNFDFAEEVLGEPDARNIWIGDERSVTGIHRDPYENLYLVLKGQKTFRLWAPVDEVCIPTRLVNTGRYILDDSNTEPQFSVQVDDAKETIPWVDLDPLTLHDHGGHHKDLLSKVHQVDVQEGQILYLPAGWYHHVTQACGQWEDGSRAPCIAVNYWYDMDYEGDKYVLRQLVSKMAESIRDSEHQMNGTG